jgi:hypothetical protein
MINSAIAAMITLFTGILNFHRRQKIIYVDDGSFVISKTFSQVLARVGRNESALLWLTCFWEAVHV